MSSGVEGSVAAGARWCLVGVVWCAQGLCAAADAGAPLRLHEVVASVRGDRWEGSRSGPSQGCQVSRGVLVPGIDALDLPVVGLDALDGRAGAHHAVLDPLARDHPVVRIEGIGYLVLARAAGDAALQARDTSMPALALLELQGVTSSRDTDSLAADHLTRNPQ